VTFFFWKCGAYRADFSKLVERLPEDVLRWRRREPTHALIFERPARRDYRELLFAAYVRFSLGQCARAGGTRVHTGQDNDRCYRVSECDDATHREACSPMKSLGVVEVESGIDEMIVRAESEAQTKPLPAAANK
jgi:hypothetical protein